MALQDAYTWLRDYITGWPAAPAACCCLHGAAPFRSQRRARHASFGAPMHLHADPSAAPTTSPPRPPERPSFAHPAIKSGHLHPFTHVERLAREATRRDPWGPTGLQLAELADATHRPDHCRVVLAVLCYRLTRAPEKWRNVYKVRTLWNHQFARASELRCVGLQGGPERVPGMP
jgi:hypothetical protein